MYVVWKTMESAPRDKFIWVWCPAYEELDEIVCLCRWHEEAGFCVDELRTPMLWTEAVAPPFPTVLKRKTTDD